MGAENPGTGKNAMSTFSTTTGAKENPRGTGAFDFAIGRYRFSFEAKDPVVLTRHNKGNVLRGAFGSIFKELCCGRVCTRCADSPLRHQCAYAAVFEPSPPEDSVRLRANQDIPRPFVFRPPPDDKDRYEAGDAFHFDLVLFGRALEYAAYFVVAFRELAARGIGVGRGRCELRSITALDRAGVRVEVYSGETNMVRPVSDPLRAADLLVGTGRAPIRTIRLRFLTPTLIRGDGQTLTIPEFHVLIKRLRDRINAIGWFYGGVILDLDYAEYGRRAEAVRIAECSTEWQHRERFSTRTHQRHPIDGFAGEVTYEGDIEEFLPLLRLGEWIHVGKHAVLGNGQFQIGFSEALPL